MRDAERRRAGACAGGRDRVRRLLVRRLALPAPPRPPGGPARAGPVVGARRGCSRLALAISTHSVSSHSSCGGWCTTKVGRPASPAVDVRTAGESRLALDASLRRLGGADLGCRLAWSPRRCSVCCRSGTGDRTTGGLRQAGLHHQRDRHRRDRRLSSGVCCSPAGWVAGPNGPADLHGLVGCGVVTAACRSGRPSIMGRRVPGSRRRCRDGTGKRCASMTWTALRWSRSLAPRAARRRFHWHDTQLPLQRRW